MVGPFRELGRVVEGKLRLLLSLGLAVFAQDQERAAKAYGCEDQDEKGDEKIHQHRRERRIGARVVTDEESVDWAHG